MSSQLLKPNQETASPESIFSRRWVRAVLLLALFLGLVLWTTWPLAQHATSMLPMGDSHFNTVPIFNLWTIWWNCESATNGWEGYWDAPIFFPRASTFAFSEPQPVTALLTPILSLTNSSVAAYNVYLWLSLLLNGIFAYRLLRYFECDVLPAAGTGCVVILLPLLHEQRDVIQLVPLWTFLWAWQSCFQLAEKPSLRNSMELALAGVVALGTCVHHTLFFLILMLLTVWFLPARWKSRAWWGYSCAAAGLFALFALPIVLPLQKTATKYDFHRRQKTVTNLSARPVDFAVTSGKELIPRAIPNAYRNDAHFHLSIGTIRTGLACFGLLFGLAVAKFRRRTLFLAVNVAVAILIAHGANLKIGDWQPWFTISDVLPGLKQVRSVFRFAYFSQLGTGLLCGFAFQAVWMVSRKLSLRLAVIAVSLLSAVAVLDAVPDKVELSAVSRATPSQKWIAFLRSEVKPNEGVLCLPMAAGMRVADFEITARWMYWATMHKAKLVNGYSGFFPSSHSELRQRANKETTEEFTLSDFRNFKVAYIVVATKMMDDPFAGKELPSPFRAIPVLEDKPAGIRIYRFEAARTGSILLPPTPPGK